MQIIHRMMVITIMSDQLQREKYSNFCLGSWGTGWGLPVIRPGQEMIGSNDYYRSYKYLTIPINAVQMATGTINYDH